ncbi:hypothetical protein [Streptomyces sp. NPDC048111]|uniref:hypothetical protein n=1 Tax=Streptomyces sp. NPDC048111 TaxID=3365500 RepID=UPI0037125F15
MADERHEWLDGVAAERLLRGEGVEPGDERARDESARLSALLSSLAPTGPATTELPGEQAALAAFRAARADGAAKAAGAKDAGARDGEALGVVRVGRAARLSEAPRRRRFAPVRLGLAAALACCALGGVAVAAGTGVLPGPFTFDDRDPAPASSVSAAVTPDPVATSPSRTLPPGTPEPDRAVPSSGAPVPDDPQRSASPGGPATGSTAGPGRKDGTPQPGDPGDDRDGAKGGQWLARTTQDCRAYRAGSLDADKRRSLESAAHGPGAVKAFCDLLLDSGSGGKGGAGGDGKGGGDKDHGKGGDGGKHGGGGGGGKQSSVGPRGDTVLDWLKPGALATARAR